MQTESNKGGRVIPCHERPEVDTCKVMFTLYCMKMDTNKLEQGKRDEKIKKYCWKWICKQKKKGG